MSKQSKPEQMLLRVMRVAEILTKAHMDEQVIRDSEADLSNNDTDKQQDYAAKNTRS